jgi:Nif-specific regulatory protein
MSLTSHQKQDFDNGLLEIEELYRQRKPDIAGEKVKKLKESGFSPTGYDQGLYNLLLARAYSDSGEYELSIGYCEKANKSLSSSVFHRRVGQVQWLLYKNYSFLGDLKKARTFARDAYAFFKRIKDTEGMIDALNGLGKIAFMQCDYAKAIDYVNDSIELSRGDNIRMTRLIGNLGRIELLVGDWESAEKNIKTALKLADELNLPKSSARNHLSLGMLYLRQRMFSLASSELRSASIFIEKTSILRENIILLEYEGDCAFAMGDIVGAKKALTNALELSRSLAPDSALASQVIRRLSDVEFALDNIDEALRLAQKALDLSTKLGEKTEIGFSQISIARIFSARSQHETALDYAQKGLEVLRKVGDPYDLARNLLIVAELYTSTGSIGQGVINKTFEEAFRLFNGLKLFYWSGETRLRHGIYNCEIMKVSSGFRNLYEAEKIFDKISERAKIRSIQLFMQELARQAVATSLSQDNEYKIFGKYFNDNEYGELRSGHINEILEIVSRRTGAGRALIYCPDRNNGHSMISPLNISKHHQRKFIQQFSELLGEEIDREKPTLLFDTRRDPFINELLPADGGHAISSVLVTPLKLSNEINGYLYLDRVVSNGQIVPFGQNELNFVVGFADLIALKLAEYDRLQLEVDNKRLKAQLLEEAAFPNIITQNKQLLEMLSRVQQVVDSDISLSIEGETGSGKDLLAKAIHYGSNRRDRRFISVNCAALPESLLESELFGYNKGAFTGADRNKAGLFEEADQGTFFLDEIADMPFSIQAKVLRVLEEKEIVRLGDSRPVKVDVRIISATNKDLKVEMEAGRFRQDLYYRLTALCFRIPPLRDRKEDIQLLVNHFADGRVRFAPDAIRAMVAFDWPGNVRELENEVKKLILLAGDSGIVDKSLLSSKIADVAGEASANDLNVDTSIDFSPKFSLYDYLAEYEKQFIIKALRDQRGVKKHAAAYLNIPESTLRLKIKQYNIDLKTPGSIH